MTEVERHIHRDRSTGRNRCKARGRVGKGELFRVKERKGHVW